MLLVEGGPPAETGTGLRWGIEGAPENGVKCTFCAKNSLCKLNGHVAVCSVNSSFSDTSHDVKCYAYFINKVS